MRVVLIFVMLLVLTSVCYSQSLSVKIYTEDEKGNKKFGDLEVRPGAQVNAFIEIQNENLDRTDDDQQIEDIEVTLVIQDIDDGSDIEEEYDDFDLIPTRSESLPFSFSVPLQVESIDYPIKIEVVGTEAGEEFLINQEYDVSVNKETHELFFNTLEFNPEVVDCNSVSYLEIEIYNLGEVAEDVDLSISNEKGGWSVQREFEVEEYPGDDTYTERIPVKIPPDMATGNYPYKVEVRYGARIETKELYLGVECGDVPLIEEPPKLQEQEVQVEDEKESQDAPISSSTPATAQEIVVNRGNSWGGAVIVIILIGIIIAIALIVLLRRK